jgi:hypothetical protein
MRGASATVNPARRAALAARGAFGWQSMRSCAILLPHLHEAAGSGCGMSNWPFVRALARPDAVCRGLATTCLVALTACGGGGPQVLEEAPLDREVRPTGLVLVPVGLALPEANALEVAAVSNLAANYLLQHTDLPIVGLYDMGLNKPPLEVVNAAADTDLLVRAGDIPIDFRTWIAVQFLITENRATNVRDIVDTRIQDPKKPNTWRQRGFDSRVRVEVKLADPLRGRQLAIVVIEDDDDPTAGEPGGDPRPGVTRLVKLALARLIASSGDLLKSGQRRSRGDGMVDSVPAMTGWGSVDLPSWEQSHRDDPEVVREAASMSLWDRFAPGLTVAEVRAASASRGVLIRQAMAPLEAGDVVLMVAGKPVSAIHQVDRLLQGCGTGACPVLVLRAGQRTEVDVRWPALPSAENE